MNATAWVRYQKSKIYACKKREDEDKKFSDNEYSSIDTSILTEQT